MVSAEDRCNTEDLTVRNGDSRGACDDAPLPLQKVIASVLREYAQNPSVATALHSPAYDVLREFQVTSYQIGEVFDRYFDLKIDPDNYDLRQATCDWFVENFDVMVGFIPEGFPRTIQSDDENNSGFSSFTNQEPIFYAAVSFASVAIFVVLMACIATVFDRNQRAIRLAPIEFLMAMLLGLLMVSVGSVLIAIPNPTNAICISSTWIVNVGYTFEVVPIIVKMTAIFQMIRAAERMQHVEVSKKSLFTALVAPLVVVIGFLVAWTVIDPPQQEYEYDQTEVVQTTTDSNNNMEYVIVATPYCSSEHDSWYWAAVAWQFLLLVIATAQSFQARAIIRKLEDENQTLSFMIYSHFVFVLLRVATYVFEGNFSYQSLAMARSLVYSVDTIFTVVIYFVPKLFNMFQTQVSTNTLSSTLGSGLGDNNKKAASGARSKNHPSDGNVPKTKSEREYDYLERVTYVDGDIDDIDIDNRNTIGDLDGYGNGFPMASDDEEIEDTANSSDDNHFDGSHRIRAIYGVEQDGLADETEHTRNSSHSHNRSTSASLSTGASGFASSYKRRPSGGDDQVPQPGAYQQEYRRQSSGGLNGPPMPLQQHQTPDLSSYEYGYASSDDDDDEFDHPGYE